MKESFESIAVLVGFIIIAEVINECVGFRLVDVKVNKNTIRNNKS